VKSAVKAKVQNLEKEIHSEKMVRHCLYCVEETETGERHEGTEETDGHVLLHCEFAVQQEVTCLENK
jgi:hypothetical protein